MVLRTLPKFDSKAYPKMDWYMPGFCKKTISHHTSVIPLYVFTFGGVIACGFYCYKLLAYQDTGLRKSGRAEVQQNEQIPLIAMPRVVDYKNNAFPESRPKI